MKIVVLRRNLANAVTNVQKAVATKSIIPALEGILVTTRENAIELSGYNQDIGITTEINARVINPGNIVISAKLFGEMVKKLPNEEIAIETDDKYIVHITSGTAEYDIIGMSANEYPTLPEVSEKEKVEIDGKQLHDMINSTVYAVSDNMQKPLYTGSLYKFSDNEFTIVAIDGYRMAVRKEPVPDRINTEFVVPKKTQQELLKLIESKVNIIIGDRYILFDLGEYRLISRLIEANFLDYKQTIPKECKTNVIVKAQEMINAIDRMSLLVGDKIQSPVVMTINDNIEFSCKSTIGKANEIIYSDIDGEQVTIGFNNRYLIEAFRNIDGDEARVELSGGLSPIIIKPIKGDSYINLVVPMRLTN